MGYVGKSVGYVGKSVGYAAIIHTFQPMKSIRSDVPWYKYIYIYVRLFLICMRALVFCELNSRARKRNDFLA